jgi:hypothetical protein
LKKEPVDVRAHRPRQFIRAATSQRTCLSELDGAMKTSGSKSKKWRATSCEVFSCRILKRRQAITFLLLLWTSSLASFMLGVSSFGQRVVDSFAGSGTDISAAVVRDHTTTTGDP